jgi:DNA-directed RNA polymerase subunit RPC12/RpoP
MPNNRKSNSLAKVLDSMTTEGDSTLTEHLQNNDLRCYACGHKCLIKEGRRGICKVRYNEGGQLRVPFNYVAALQCDPTEKKPFFHALPGSDTLTFGMLGCDLHCSYCFTGDTKVVTSKGPTAFEKLFESAERIDEAPGAHIAYPNDLYVIAASGDLKKFRQFSNISIQVIFP